MFRSHTPVCSAALLLLSGAAVGARADDPPPVEDQLQQADDTAGVFNDYGDAPDGVPGCGIAGGVGFFPTIFGTANAVAGRTSPQHFPAPIEYTVGATLTYEAAANQPFCDWFTPGCDDPGPPISDDGALILCLNPACTSGVTVSAGVCGIGFGGAFGPSPGPLPDGFWILSTTRTPFSTVPGFLNVVSDHDLSGMYGDSPVGWCLKDAPIAPNPFGIPLVQLHVTAPFPVFTIAKLPLGRWSIGPFWNRFIASPELMTGSFFATYDGSGAPGGYPFGETEDWLPLTDPGDEWKCTTPRHCFPSNSTLVVSLNPNDTQCLQGVPVNLVSSGMPYGDLREFRTGPYRTNHPVPIEIISLSLQGVAPALGGPVRVSERTDKMSMGLLHRVLDNGAGNLQQAESFFDVFFSVELPALGTILNTRNAPLRLQAINPIHSFPSPVPYQMQSSGPVRLFDQNGQHRGWVCFGDLRMGPAFDWKCPGDANGDRVVNFADISEELAKWGTGGPPGDSNDTCFVDFADVTQTLATWGAICPSISP